MTAKHGEAAAEEMVLLVCDACGTTFEQGIADPTQEGEERCPQCGLSESRPARDDERTSCAILKSTKFR